MSTGQTGDGQMATKMITKGSVQFNGEAVALGQPMTFDGKTGVPFMAWVRDGVTPDGFKAQPASTTIRVKWAHTYMPSDFTQIGAAA